VSKLKDDSPVAGSASSGATYSTVTSQAPVVAVVSTQTGSRRMDWRFRPS